MAKGRKTRGAKAITARQRSARRKNIAIARKAKKKGVKKKRTVSAETRKKMSEAQRRAWNRSDWVAGMH